MTAHSYADRRTSCPTPLGRFVKFIEKTEDCWSWRGYRTPSGYGQFSYFGKADWAHRLSYRFHVGEIPEGLQLDHLCRNRACVKPAHLEPVTTSENTRRGIRTSLTHCPRGHPYSGYNLIVRFAHRKGRTYSGRVCRQCGRDKQRAAYHAGRAA